MGAEASLRAPKASVKDMNVPKITKHEMHVFFTQLDLDGDGLVSVEDVLLWLRTMGWHLQSGYILRPDVEALFHPGLPKFVKRRGLGTAEGRAYQVKGALAMPHPACLHGVTHCLCLRGQAHMAKMVARKAAERNLPVVGVRKKPRATQILLFGALLPHEVAALKKRFAMTSEQQVDGGGCLRLKAFTKLVQELTAEAGMPKPTKKDLVLAFEIADEDGSGTMNLTEFLQLFAAIKKGEIQGLGGTSAFEMVGKIAGNAAAALGRSGMEQRSEEMNADLIPDHLDGYREAIKSEMDSEGRLTEGGLMMALGRRPHLGANLRLLSKAFERTLENLNGNFLNSAPAETVCVELPSSPTCTAIGPLSCLCKLAPVTFIVRT